jgi:hypothetical protein
MHDIRISGTALLVSVALSRELEGFAERRQILARTAGANALLELMIELLDWSRRSFYDGGSYPGLRTRVGIWRHFFYFQCTGTLRLSAHLELGGAFPRI